MLSCTILNSEMSEHEINYVLVHVKLLAQKKHYFSQLNLIVFVTSSGNTSRHDQNFVSSPSCSTAQGYVTQPKALCMASRQVCISFHCSLKVEEGSYAHQQYFAILWRKILGKMKYLICIIRKKGTLSLHGHKRWKNVMLELFPVHINYWYIFLQQQLWATFWSRAWCARPAQIVKGNFCFPENIKQKKQRTGIIECKWQLEHNSNTRDENKRMLKNVDVTLMEA